jgi:hypothetical protein
VTRRTAARGHLAGPSSAVGLLIALALVVAACGGAAETPPAAAFTPPPRTSSSAEPSASEEVPGSPIAGIVTAVDSAGLSQVKGFTLRTVGGEDLKFVLGTLENGTEFPPGHLAEHMAAADPILVYFRPENGALVVYRLEDAP